MTKDICKALRAPQWPGERVAELYIEAADEIEQLENALAEARKLLGRNFERREKRLKKQVHELTSQIEHYHGKWGKPEKEVYDKIKGHAVTHSDEEIR